MVFLKVETVPKMGGGVMLIPVWLVLSCCCCCVICLNFSVCCARGAATSGGYPDPEAGYSDTSAMHDEDDLTGDSYGAFDATPVVVGPFRLEVGNFFFFFWTEKEEGGVGCWDGRKMPARDLKMALGVCLGWIG